MTALLRARGVPFAVIGAAAMAVHGVSRATRDLDLLVVSALCLAPPTWAALECEGVDVSIRRGDADDPLAGAVRVMGPGDSPIDVVVGREAWQGAILGRAIEQAIEGVSIPVVTAADLILLKLYAGGPQDAWDVEQLLASSDRAALVARVEAVLPTLPEEAWRLWARIVGPR